MPIDCHRQHADSDGVNTRIVVRASVLHGAERAYIPFTYKFSPVGYR